MSALAFRPADESDAAFILDTFLRSFRDSYAAGLIQDEDWWAVMGPQLQKLLTRPGVEVTVAYDPAAEQGYDLHGWVAVEHGHTQPLLLYVYVKEPKRGFGVGSRLLKEAGIDPAKPFYFAARTKATPKLLRKFPAARWNPNAARFPKRQPPEGAR